MAVADLPVGTSAEGLMSIARSLLGNQDKYEKVIYYRQPRTVLDDRGRPRPHLQAGWICSRTSQAFRLWENLERGFEPLTKYGPIRYTDATKGDTTWKAILSHPDGPKEFPVEQLMAYGWYDPDRVEQDTGVRVHFPQLEGMTFEEWMCPEFTTCFQKRFPKPEFLFRHLSVQHSYTRERLMAVAEELGIPLAAEFKKRAVSKKFEYKAEADTPSSAEVEAALPVINRVTPVAPPETPLPRRKRGRGVWTPERKAAASAAGKARWAARVGVEA